MLTLEVIFRPALKKQRYFDHQIIFSPTLKTSHIRSPAQKSSQFGPPTKNEVKLHAHPKNK